MMVANLLDAYMAPARGPAPAPNVLEECGRLVASATTIDIAAKAFQKLMPSLKKYTGSPAVLKAGADLLERSRIKTGMLETWTALHIRFPQDTHFLRMRLRWLRRGKYLEEGHFVINQTLPDRAKNIQQGAAALVAYSELQAYGEIDVMMNALLPRHPEDSTLRILYAKNLMQQNRFVTALNVVSKIKNPERLSSTPLKLIAEIKVKARCQKDQGAEDVVGLLGNLVGSFASRTPRKRASNSLGNVVFYTGQLGAGGAERQLTRIAVGLEEARVSNAEIGGIALDAPLRVAVRHASPESGADFFLPVLKQGNITPFIANNGKMGSVADLKLNNPELERLLTFLPADILESTLRLVPYFKNNKIDVAYLWQDGGILISALAALIAGVPLIIPSFRGLPPNLRPDLYRPQLEGLYRNLAQVPGVVFSTNSKAAALAYADWLDIPVERFKVIYNALVPASTAADPCDLAMWRHIQARSQECQKTVVGVFRFDPNKRPVFWIKTAAAYLESNPNTRFIIVGQGNDFAKCEQLIKDLGIENRVFLVGRSNHVGFWLEKAQVLLHLAQFEGLPNAVIEAQIAGLPVIATPAGGTSEAMIHGKTGFCLSSQTSPSKHDVLQLLETLLHAPEKTCSMGKAAQLFAKDRFNLARALRENVWLFMTQTSLEGS